MKKMVIALLFGSVFGSDLVTQESLQLSLQQVESEIKKIEILFSDNEKVKSAESARFDASFRLYRAAKHLPSLKKIHEELMLAKQRRTTRLLTRFPNHKDIIELRNLILEMKAIDEQKDKLNATLGKIAAAQHNEDTVIGREDMEQAVLEGVAQAMLEFDQFSEMNQVFIDSLIDYASSKLSSQDEVLLNYAREEQILRKKYRTAIENSKELSELLADEQKKQKEYYAVLSQLEPKYGKLLGEREVLESALKHYTSSD